jgi:hypothetical protein
VQTLAELRDMTKWMNYAPQADWEFPATLNGIRW